MRSKEFTPGSQDLVIFDIDDTLMHTTAKIKVVKDGQMIKDLSNQEFNNYQLQPGEKFDFGEFRNAEKFRQESKPIEPMVRKLKTIAANAGNAKVIMLTARADFDDKDKFLQTFRDIGIDMSKIHVHRAGNLPGNEPPAYKKAVWVRRYLDTKQYAHVRLYDDSISNLRVFKALQQEYPTVDFRAIYVGPQGNTQTVEEARKKKRKTARYRFGAYGPGPYGWYGHDSGYSGDGGGGDGGESIKHESANHFSSHHAVAQLKSALMARKQQLKAAADDQVYDIIDKIMTRIAKAANISGKKLHDLWVKQYHQIPDKWIMKESQSSSCARTRAAECQCESVNRITEAQETVTAICVLEHSDTVKGTILFKQQPGMPTLVVGKITGLAPGQHGFHIHEFGDLSNGCESAGDHYNPDGVDHGNLDEGHAGDLGNVTADKNGVADIKIIAKRIGLEGDRSVVGRAVVIHQDQDDLGQGGDAESLKTGNAGDRLACGVITLKVSVNENFADGKNPQDKGDSKRHGINTKSSVSSLRKTAKSGGRKGQLAHWLANMKSGRAKKNK